RTKLKEGRNLRTANHPFLARVSMELRIFFTKPVMLLYALWIGLEGTELQSDVLNSEYGSLRYPPTGLITPPLQHPVFLVGMLLVIYYGAEMFWREQRVRISSILDATPASGASMLLAKWTALVVLIASIIVSGIGLGAALQIARGYHDGHLLLYLSLF